MTWLRLAGGIALAALLSASAALATSDHGQRAQDDLESGSMPDFGVGRPLAASSTAQISQADAQADPRKLATPAQGLSARVVTSGVAAPNIDMISLWPDDRRPTHLIFCNEEGTAEPGLQRLELATGQVQTIVTGTSDCDPTRRTPWGTILFGEEAGGGATGG